MSSAEFSRAAKEQRQRRERERDQRTRDSIASFGTLNARAHGTDRSVVVEVVAGGQPLAIELSHEALNRGAAALRANILTAARRATSRANFRAHEVFGYAMGASGATTADQLGLSYAPELLDDENDEPPEWR